jgi:predicted RNA-binding protein associated with RNAse of E/G family
MATLYRKRLIPSECVELKDDTIVYQDSDRIVTIWNTLKPKKEFSHGISYYVMNEGIKVSKFYRDDNSLTYIYVDIINTEYNQKEDSYVFTDLLADVIVDEDGKYRVVDLDELADAINKGIISKEYVSESLQKLNNLLLSIYNGTFKEYVKFIERFELSVFHTDLATNKT